MNSRKIASQRTGKIRKLFRSVAFAGMLAVSTIMPLKRAEAGKERKAKVTKVQKPKWAKQKKKKEKPGGPSITLNLFGGAYDKLKTPFVGAGINANQSFGPINVNVLFEIAANGVEKLVVENAEVDVTLPLRRPEQNKNLPLSVTLYTYRGRICYVDTGIGGAFHIGKFTLGMEYDFPGPVAPVYLNRNFQLFDGRLSLTPVVIFVTNKQFLGGRLNISVKLTDRLNANGQFWTMTDPATEKLLAVQWRAGVGASF